MHFPWFVTIVAAVSCFVSTATSQSSTSIGISEPMERSLDRYAHIWTEKPFLVASTTNANADSAPQRFAITGYGALGGDEIIFLLDRTTLTRFSVSPQKPDNGVELIQVTDKENARQLKARIRVGGEMIDLSYDPAIAAPLTPDNSNNASVATPTPEPVYSNTFNATGSGVLPPAGVPQPQKVVRRPPISTQ